MRESYLEQIGTFVHDLQRGCRDQNIDYVQLRTDTPLNVAAESEVMKLAERFYTDLCAQGIDVILDDRNERPGVKFKDSELVGFPIRLGIGEKSLSKGEVEIKPRAGALLAVTRERALEKIIQLAGAS